MIRGFENQNNSKGNNSRLKSGASGKKKIVFAKDPKEAALAIIIVAIFILKSAYDLTMYLRTQYISEHQNQSASTKLANEQQQNLESLNGGPTSTDAQVDANVQADANDIYTQTVNMQGNQPALPPTPNVKNPNIAESDVDVISKKSSLSKNYKMALIPVADSGRSNPFSPGGGSAEAVPKFSLLAPPDQSAVNPDAADVIGTTISGILYDKYSPSAIINISGVDYLVKKGDIINRYKVLSISKDQVVVKLGNNIYKAGVGQLLEESKMNYNTVANLNKKFGGNEVSIGVKKKKH